MVVHLYTQCWNDERMLPFFFRHYDRLVDRYFIFDDGSTDGSRPLLVAHPKVEAGRFERSVPDSFALSELAFSNECWKRSRGKADWVIVVDIDEHLFHAEGRDYLARCAVDGVTMIPALGFQMISETPPEPAEDLCQDHPHGAPSSQMMKLGVFNPDALTEVNFQPGRHRAAPLGRTRAPCVDELLLLHYKYMGFEQTYDRHCALRQGMRRRDIERNWGYQYFWSRERLREDWTRVERSKVDTRPIRADPARHYPVRHPWWARYRNEAPAGGIDGIVAASKAIAGWIEEDGARELAKTCYSLDGEPTIVEIGTYMGRCSALLAGARGLRGGGRVHCVDPFDCSGDPFSVPHYRKGLEATGLASLEAAFRRNMAGLGLDRSIDVHVGTACDVAKTWSQPVDLLVLDGDQSPRGAREAYDAWLPHLKRGGTVVLCNSARRRYAAGHDGHRRLAIEQLVAPHYAMTWQVGSTTFATRSVR